MRMSARLSLALMVLICVGVFALFMAVRPVPAQANEDAIAVCKQRFLAGKLQPGDESALVTLRPRTIDAMGV
jgi:hypothetical protein